MYTFNIFVFGHRLGIDKELNNKLTEIFDYEFNSYINGEDFEISSPYHGGQVAPCTYSVIFGKYITDDDNNPNYITEIRNAKEEDYIEDYKKFIEQVKIDLLSDKGIEDDYDDFCDRLIKFIDTNKPEFYSIEASS